MQRVRVVDADGYMHQYLVTDSTPDEEIEKGLPCDPPDVRQLDWNEIARELHNLLLRRGLVTLDDVNAQQNAVGNTILSVIRPRVIALYKQKQMMEV